MTEQVEGNPVRPVGYWQLFASEWYVRSGQLHDRMGRAIDAETNYRKALARQPHQLSALSGLGRLLLRGQRYDEAVEVWRKVVGLKPSSASMTFQLSRALHRSGQLEQAADQYLRVVTLDPAHEKAFAALEELGSRLAGRGGAARTDGLEAAARIGKQLLARDPNSARARASALAIARTISAGAFRLVGQVSDRALAQFDAALTLAPDLPEALRGSVLCFEQLGRLGEALATLERQIRADPSAVEPKLQWERIRATLDVQEGKAASAQPPFERPGHEAMLAHARRLAMDGTNEAASARPPFEHPGHEAILAHARRLVMDGTNEAASALQPRDREVVYRQILGRDAVNTQALSNLARLYVRQQRWTDATDVLARLNILQPNSIETKRLLARAFLLSGRLENAARIYDDLSGLEPDSAVVWQSLGEIQKRLANWAAARVAWARLTEIWPDELEPRFQLALACHRTGDVEGAQAELQKVLAGEPDHRAALGLLGRVRLATDPDGSMTYWLRLSDLDPAAVEPRLQIARIHLRQGRLQDAEASFREVIERQPVHGEALASLGKILAHQNPEEALQLFARWSEQDPAAVAPWLGIGRLHADAKRSDLAEASFLQALNRGPSNIEALTRLGRLYSGNKRTDEALRLWTKVSELLPEAFEPKLQVARLLNDRHDPKAEEALRSVLKVDPQNREVLRRLAQLLGREAATIESALEVWSTLADLSHDPAFAIVHRARLFDRLGRKPEAEKEYRRALEFAPRHPMALGDLAEFYRRRQRWQEAIEIYRTHLLDQPERIDVILGLAQCLDRIAQLDGIREAEELYSRALTLDPNNVTALGYRGRLLRQRGQIEDAISHFRRICALEPGNADAWRELIFYLAGAEKETEALAELETAEAALGATPEAWAVLGRAAAAALFEDRAIEYFERAIAAAPDNPTYRAQLGLHYLRLGVVDGAFHHLLDSRDLDPTNVEVARGLFDATRALRELGFDHIAIRRTPRTVGEILIPERLFHHARQIAETKVKPYQPVPRSVVAISASLAPGGAERQLVNMLRGLSDSVFGLDLTLFCISLAPRLRRDFFLPVLDGTGVKVVSLDAVDADNCLWHPDVVPFAEVIRHFPSDMVVSIAFWLQEFRRRRPQVVHAWQDSTNLTAVVAALLAGVPRIVLCCRSVHPDNPRRRLRRFMREAYRAVLSHPTVVLSNNSQAGAHDYAEWLDMASNRIEVVYNGVDFDRLHSSLEEAEQARRQLGVPDGVPVLGGVFRMSEEKRPLLWLDVAAAVARRDETVHFVVCGDGPMREEMVKHAAALGIADRVHMPGPQSNIGSWYRMMSVVMLTSRHEGLPNVLLEAQSLGIPVVAPDVGGMSEVVEQGVTGWTIRNADAESLAERVVHCLSDQAWRQAAFGRAPTFVRERFGIGTMLRRNLEVYGMTQDAAHNRFPA